MAGIQRIKDDPGNEQKPEANDASAQRETTGGLGLEYGFHCENAACMWPNDPKLSDRGVRRGTCMVGGKAAVEAGAVTHGAVRCSAWLGASGRCIEMLWMLWSWRSGSDESRNNGAVDPG